MAYELSNRLEKNSNAEMLQLLASNLNTREITKGQKA